ncbi:hypothetical protein PV327_001537 [Microctonus hyperodae]|uniref:Uncharacterized protein n=1 Tax=Microctonus hyperodae TaxID=165561 RepID=A0AA39G9G5_MICHY|nr:hypothetical protein PV327_001537 [Microctonus hyperodae]
MKVVDLKTGLSRREIRILDRKRELVARLKSINNTHRQHAAREDDIGIEARNVDNEDYEDHVGDDEDENHLATTKNALARDINADERRCSRKFQRERSRRNEGMVQCKIEEKTEAAVLIEKFEEDINSFNVHQQLCLRSDSRTCGSDKVCDRRNSRYSCERSVHPWSEKNQRAEGKVKTIPEH